MNTLNLASIQQLSVTERIQLVEDIWDSIATAPETLGLTENQQQELDDRLVAHQGAVAGSAWAEVKARLQS